MHNIVRFACTILCNVCVQFSSNFHAQYCAVQFACTILCSFCVQFSCTILCSFFMQVHAQYCWLFMQNVFALCGCSFQAIFMYNIVYLILCTFCVWFSSNSHAQYCAVQMACTILCGLHAQHCVLCVCSSEAIFMHNIVQFFRAFFCIWCTRYLEKFPACGGLLC